MGECVWEGERVISIFLLRIRAAMQIQITEATRELLKRIGGFVMAERGPVSVKVRVIRTKCKVMLHNYPYYHGFVSQQYGHTAMHEDKNNVQSILSCLPGHVTRCLMPYGIGDIDCLNRLNVIEIRSAVQWHSVFAFFFPFYTTCQKVLSSLKMKNLLHENSTDYSG